VVLSNFGYYVLHLRGLVEDNLYQSHMTITSLAEVLSHEVLRFNLILAGASVIAVVCFYLFIRIRIKSFFAVIKKSLQSRMDRPFEKSLPVSFKEEFAGIDRILQDFFKEADIRTEHDKQRLSTLKEKLKALKK